MSARQVHDTAKGLRGMSPREWEAAREVASQQLGLGVSAMWSKAPDIGPTHRGHLQAIGESRSPSQMERLLEIDHAARAAGKSGGAFAGPSHGHTLASTTEKCMKAASRMLQQHQ